MWSIWIVALSLIHYGYTQTVPRVCPPILNPITDCSTAKFSSDCAGEDSDCEEGLKCCPSECGSQNCRKPLLVLIPELKPDSGCDIGDPLPNVFCGRDQPNCPTGYHCKISPFDAKNGICCKDNEPTACYDCCGAPPCCSTCIRCDVGDPLPNVFCGEDQPGCPKGYQCKISPFDETNGICCKDNGIL
ncbi:cadmium metallothionein-like isoform X2 [Mytilus trossulus]|uniref:cadmium metallothionein-like isoform X2 n=1 Tax=Mytilus trossulus TaxID=6551 RepID=UPI0030041C55